MSAAESQDIHTDVHNNRIKALKCINKCNDVRRNTSEPCFLMFKHILFSSLFFHVVDVADEIPRRTSCF